MGQRVYIETSVFGYLTGRPSRDMIIAAHQELTRQWWETRSPSFDLLVSEGPIPRDSAADAVHIAIAAVNGADYLLPWNCKHLANAVIRHRIETLVEEAGHACPAICTPEELMEESA